jgi:alcohol/geraniol dehydrogenase (NADP+)
MTTHAYAAYDAHPRLAPFALAPFEYEPEALGPLDVEVAISHCGICHTDLHLIHNDLGFSTFPLVPGHEIVGTVVARGHGVDALAIGQRVGSGWQAGACFQCEWCLNGEENLCLQGQPTSVGRHGGYADRIRLDSRFVFPIPDAISSAEAAPLFCAGVTVFSPLVHYGVNAQTRLGVVGIGGLGHLALQYGRALGSSITAFSTTRSKEEEARLFGAHEFVDMSNEESMAATVNRFDFILATSSADLPWTALIHALRPNGTLCIVGVPENNVNFPAFPLFAGQKRVIGSAFGARDTISRMLTFSAEHNIHPQIECYPITQVNTALDRLQSGQARYRIVLQV